MITLLGSLFGFLSAMLPEGLSFLRERADREHELKILSLQMEQQRLGHTQRLDEIRVQSDSAEMRALYKTYQSGVEWVDALNGTVRPVLAYSFFLLYAVVKLYQFGESDMSLPWTVERLWGEEDQAIFAGIISFYFGQRAFRKARG